MKYKNPNQYNVCFFLLNIVIFLGFYLVNVHVVVTGIQSKAGPLQSNASGSKSKSSPESGSYTSYRKSSFKYSERWHRRHLGVSITPNGTEIDCLCIPVFNLRLYCMLFNLIKFWNALVRKGKTDGASEEDMETV